jgi:hypothetical protein
MVSSDKSQEMFVGENWNEDLFNKDDLAG